MKKWRIVLGADDAALSYKETLKADLQAHPRVESVEDVSVDQAAHATHYPTMAISAAERVANGEADRGLLLCGTGLGVAISANKVPGIRAFTAHEGYSVERGVKSNNAQILCMGQRVVGIELARKLVSEWLEHEFDPESASAEKVAEITDYEAQSSSTKSA
jgi:ribose 5-phosphate isomerase B